MRRIAFVMLVGVTVAACGAKPASETGRTVTPPASDDAVDPLVAACEAGTVKSCLRAASSAESAGEFGEAARLYNIACELGEATGCALAGAVLAEDPQTLSEAATAFEKGCALGDGASCYGAGLALSGAFGGTADPERAKAAFKAGCDAGLAEACAVYADALESTDPAAAKQLRESACAQGDGTACIAIARQLRADGDEKEADRYLETACTHDGRGCTQLGLRALEFDPAASRTYFRRGCVSDFPDADACGWYGWFAYTGAGGEVAQGEGASVLQATCEAEGALACMFEAVKLQREGDPQASARMARACALDESQCDAMRRQYESLTQAR